MARESTIGSIFYLEVLPAGATSPVTAVTAGSPTDVTTVLSAAAGDFIVLDGGDSPTLDRSAAHRVSDSAAGVLSVDTDTTGETITAFGTARKVSSVEI